MSTLHTILHCKVCVSVSFDHLYSILCMNLILAIYRCVCVLCVCVCVCCVCVCVCVCVRERERERERESGRMQN